MSEKYDFTSFVELCMDDTTFNEALNGITDIYSTVADVETQTVILPRLLMQYAESVFQLTIQWINNHSEE